VDMETFVHDLQKILRGPIVTSLKVICVNAKEIGRNICECCIADDNGKIAYVFNVQCDSVVEALVKVLNICLDMFEGDIALFTFSNYIPRLLRQKSITYRGRRHEFREELLCLKQRSHRIISCNVMNRNSASPKCKMAVRCVTGIGRLENDWRVEQLSR
jgi:hypothetical protein